MVNFHWVIFSLFQGLIFAVSIFLAISGRSRIQRKLNPREKFPIYGMKNSGTTRLPTILKIKKKGCPLLYPPLPSPPSCPRSYEICLPCWKFCHWRHPMLLKDCCVQWICSSHHWNHTSLCKWSPVSCSEEVIKEIRENFKYGWMGKVNVDLLIYFHLYTRFIYLFFQLINS